VPLLHQRVIAATESRSRDFKIRIARSVPAARSHQPEFQSFPQEIRAAKPQARLPAQLAPLEARGNVHFPRASLGARHRPEQQAAMMMRMSLIDSDRFQLIIATGLTKPIDDCHCVAPRCPTQQRLFAQLCDIAVRRADLFIVLRLALYCARAAMDSRVDRARPVRAARTSYMTRGDVLIY
jgi:hypothetical protein